MKRVLVFLTLLAVVGCATNPEKRTVEREPQNAIAKDTAKVGVKAAVVRKHHRVLTSRQESVLREFALRESPQLWNTIQVLRGELESRGRAMELLARELREFDRKPEEDETYVELGIGREQIACTLDTVYQKLEDAYIAFKKFQATPGRKEYSEAMNRALEDGVRAAEMTAQRYRVMSIEK